MENGNILVCGLILMFLEVLEQHTCPHQLVEIHAGEQPSDQKVQSQKKRNGAKACHPVNLGLKSGMEK